MEKIERLRGLIQGAKRTVFFGGAGVSTESGIPDFRSTDGLYRQKWRYPPETILSHTFLTEKPEEFFRFHREKLLFPDARPNAAHIALAALEKKGLLSAVITQNIDGLHQAAGSKRVIELHGSVLRNHCTRCGRRYPVDVMLDTTGIPRCGCGGVIRPDVVLYEESLPERAVADALEEISASDLLLIGGTSLSVYPAAGFVADYPGKIVIINRSPTPMDAQADLLIAEPIGQTLAGMMELMENG